MEPTITGNEPIIGADSKKIGWYPTQLVQCLCPRTDTGITILVLTGIGTSSMCPRCMRQYRISGISVNPIGNVVDMVVEMAMPERKSES